jgi:hypothetical protein
MATLTVPLSDVAFERLQHLAARAGLTPEELGRDILDEWLNRPRPDFAAASEYVLQKNAEFYRRLAQRA